MKFTQARVNTLHQLLEDNFSLSRYFRKLSEFPEDVSLQNYFQSQAARRSQFATELVDEIAFYRGKEPYVPSNVYERTRSRESAGKLWLLKNAIHKNRNSLEKYHLALCCIHEGSFREILLRHKAFIENSIFEFSSLFNLAEVGEELFSLTTIRKSLA